MATTTDRKDEAMNTTITIEQAIKASQARLRSCGNRGAFRYQIERWTCQIIGANGSRLGLDNPADYKIIKMIVDEVCASARSWRERPSHGIDKYATR
jgi:hypothetical protein